MESNIFPSKEKKGMIHIFLLSKKPKSVLIDGIKVKFQYDKIAKKLTFDYAMTSNKSNIKIK